MDREKLENCKEINSIMSQGYGDNLVFSFFSIILTFH